MVHGDDFTFLSPRKYKSDVISKMASWYDIKVRGVVGSQEDELKCITILNRELHWEPGRITVEADPSHVQKITSSMNLDSGSKGREAPVVREQQGEHDGDEAMQTEEATRFRGIVARANYLGIDRPDIQTL